jgi:preprotein translocase subunit Sss1
MTGDDLPTGHHSGTPTRRELLRRTLIGFLIGGGLGFIVGLIYIVLR